MLHRLFLLALFWTVVNSLERFQEEENAHFHFRHEPLRSLPGMVGHSHGHSGPPGFAPPTDMIRAMRKEHHSDVALSGHRGRPHLLGFSRQRVHRGRNH